MTSRSIVAAVALGAVTVVGLPACGSGAGETGNPASVAGTSTSPDVGSSDVSTNVTPSLAVGAPSTTPSVADPSTTEKEPAWVVGATPLPLRPDGLGEILPTPDVLIDRDLPTRDLLPPPSSGKFESSIDELTAEVIERMGSTWSEECPIGLEDLRYVTVSFWGFDDRAHTGELVVASSEAADVVGVFEKLFAARFPIEEMRLITDADVAAAPTGDGNTTAAFICRRARGSTTWSAHASGLAIDINPFMNPFQKGDIVLPELASAHLDRSIVRRGMIVPGDVVTEAFAAIGWSWGGEWESPVDRMHFSANGR